MIRTDATVDRPGRFLFRFAVLADTHMNPRDGASPSPWLTNRHANARTRAVVREINRLGPAFTLHLGDIVHPVPSQASYGEAATRAHQVLSGLEAPLHYVPGNHDMGDKPVAWAPAAIVNDTFLDVYARHFGQDHFVFDHAGCRFFVVNSQVLNSGSDREAEQWDWLESELAAHADRRTFLFTHYPLYVAEPDEIEHYDNIGEPARSRLLGLIEHHRVEAVFAGHVHNFFYDRHEECDFYVLPAVSAVRHDYSELFSVPPSADHEHGRDDNAKLGFFVVDVHERDHIARFVRSHGVTLEEGSETPSGRMGTLGVHVRDRRDCFVGVDMRQAWGRVVEIPYQGVVDEFYRKRARNDYLLAALWEMGIGNLRVPVADLLDEEVRARMEVLHSVGHRFLVFAYGVPTGREAEGLRRHAPLLSAVEVIVSRDEAGSLRGLRDLGVPVYLSRLRSSADATGGGESYTHFIRHGFLLDDAALAGSEFDMTGVDGVVVRAGVGDHVDEVVAGAVRWAGERDLGVIVYVSLTDENPAVLADDVNSTAARVASALFAGHALGCSVYLDTLADMDRGYFPRFGLVDRRYNPRAAGNVFRNLHTALAAGAHDGLVTGHTSGGSRILSTSDRALSLVLPSGSETTFPVSGRQVIDLESGEELPADRTREGMVGFADPPVWPLLV